MDYKNLYFKAAAIVLLLSKGFIFQQGHKGPLGIKILMTFKGCFFYFLQSAASYIQRNFDTLKVRSKPLLLFV